MSFSASSPLPPTVFEEFMKAAVHEGICGVECGDGGPFGAVVVKNGKIIARGHNMASNLIIDND